MATTITANGINFPDGSASAPSIGGTDTNTGLFTGSDIVGFATGGTERLRITSDGKIGVAEASPDHIFHIKGSTPILAVESSSWTSGVSAALRLSYTDGNAREIRGHYDHGLQFFLNPGEVMRINTSGKIRVGSGDPVYNFEVQNSGFVETLVGSTNASGAGIILDGDANGDGSGSDYCQIWHNSSGNLNYRARGASSAHTSHVFHTNTTERLRVNSDGRLFLGSSLNSNADTYKMSIKESSSENAAIMFLDTDNMKGGLCGISKGNNELISGTTNVDFVVGSLYADTHIIASPANVSNTVIAMTVEHNRIKLWENTLISNNVVLTGNTNSNIIIERLQILPSENDGYDDSHILSACQTAGNWEQGAGTSNYDTSWGWVWQYSANSTSTKQVRAGVAYDHKGAEQMKYWSSYGSHVFYTDNAASGNETAETCDTKAVTITKQGYVLKHKQPYFKANKTGRITGTGVVVWDDEVYDNGGNYDTSNGRFTAPVDGLYWFSAKINAYDRCDFWLQKNGTRFERGQYNTDSDNIGWFSNQLTSIVEMTSGQYVEVNVSNIQDQSDPGEWLTFMGYLIC